MKREFSKLLIIEYKRKAKKKGERKKKIVQTENPKKSKNREKKSAKFSTVFIVC